jgi:NhaP-type Na+/H+ or K+/H+ antiporter
MTDEQPDDEVVTITPDTVTVRRAPKFGAFMLVGAILGVLLTLILTSLFPVDPAVGFLPLFGYFALFGLVIGVVVGGLIALVLDRAGRRNARSAQAERTRVDPGPVTGELED